MITALDYARKNWLTFANFLILLTIAYRVGVAQTAIEKDVDMLKEHVHNEEVHMPYSTKVREFVPRTEFNTMKQDISEIKKDVKELIKSSK